MNWTERYGCLELRLKCGVYLWVMIHSFGVQSDAYSVSISAHMGEPGKSFAFSSCSITDFLRRAEDVKNDPDLKDATVWVHSATFELDSAADVDQLVAWVREKSAALQAKREAKQQAA